jgi:hypothetical protein
MQIGIAGAGGIGSNVGDFKTEAGSDNLYAPKVILVASIMSQIVFNYSLCGGPV